MTPITIGIIGILLMLVFIFLGMPVGFVMTLIGFVGFAFLANIDSALGLLRSIPYSSVSNYGLSVLPLFVLMGAFCYTAGLSKELYKAANNWFGHLPGGLAIATVGACAGFAAITGSSLATAITMGSVALPEMKRYKYDSALATGCIAAGGSIGILIPPSVGLVIYGIITEVSIGKLFLAGFIPGVLEAVFYMITIFIMCKINPALGPAAAKTSLVQKIISLKNTWMVVALFALVIGGIYFGIFSPTEAAGIGAFGAFIFSLAQRKLGWAQLKSSVTDTLKTTAMAFTMLVGAMFLTYFMAVSRLPNALSDFVGGLELNPYLILTGILLMYILLGCFLDAVAMIVLTIPVFFPLVVSMDFSPIWFGIIVVRAVEIGMITPPIGINVYVIKGIARDVPMQTIFKGIIPFFIADLFHVALLVAFPGICLFLPGLMN
jgi:tripartite ATP-independent transporter DctM subunit